MSGYLQYLLSMLLWGVALMSGILSIVREVLSIFFPKIVPQRSLFWNCVFIAFIISAAILWFIEHQKVEKSKPRLNAQVDVFL